MYVCVCMYVCESYKLESLSQAQQLDMFDSSW